MTVNDKHMKHYRDRSIAIDGCNIVYLPGWPEGWRYTLARIVSRPECRALIIHFRLLTMMNPLLLKSNWTISNQMILRLSILVGQRSHSTTLLPSKKRMKFKDSSMMYHWLATNIKE